MRALIDDLSRESTAFAAFWREQRVLHREGGERVFLHPTLGVRRYVQTTLLVAARPDWKVVCLVPVPAEKAARRPVDAGGVGRTRRADRG